jgi:hypothetical protein
MFIIVPSQSNGNIGKIKIMPNDSILGYPFSSGLASRCNGNMDYSICNAQDHPLTCYMLAICLCMKAILRER